MRKSTFLSILLIFGLSISSIAQTKEVLSQDKVENSKTINTSIADSQKISQSFQIKPYKFNPISLDGPRIIVIDGKVSDNGYDGIGPNDIQSLSILKGEKATSLYGNKNASGVIIITPKRDANVTKVEKEKWTQDSKILQLTRTVGVKNVYSLNRQVDMLKLKLQLNNDLIIPKITKFK